MVVAIIIICGLGLFVLAIFWYGLRGEPNEGPALGSNSPWPSDMGGQEPPYWPAPDAVISDQEQFRRSADSRLRRLGFGRRRSVSAAASAGDEERPRRAR
ncbi:MAG: hypothetical protein JOZ46_05840 [Candidatus Dormibacteraeota bacterium]|nr:hypothetical protein [Candidatus Dormibacteraeota bacterium]MBV9525320.1 hypothetical protein [Candidatus Dormibacteraeota bacterium]